MSAPHRLLSLTLFLLSTLALAEPPRGEVVVRTREGATLQGRIVSETERGYLLVGPTGSVLVEYASIVDLQPVAAAAPPPPPLPPPGQDASPPMAPAAPTTWAPRPAAPPPQYAAPAMAPPSGPPQYQAPAGYAPAQYQQPAAQAWAPAPQPTGYTHTTTTMEPGVGAPRVSAAREGDRQPRGMRFGLGFGGAVLRINDYSSVTLGVAARLDWTQGALSLQVSPGLYLFGTSTAYLIAGVDTQVHFNLVPWFAVGAGLHTGLSLGSWSCFFTGLSLSPLIFKLGAEHNHHLALWVSVPFLRIGELSSSFGGPMGTLGYSYLF